MDSNDTKESLQEADVWIRHFEHRCPEAREWLISRYGPFARSLAGGIFRQFRPEDVDFEDMVHYAYVGLIEAVDRYDQSRGAKFATFATYRIRGAVLDGVARASERLGQYATRRVVEPERIESLSDFDDADPFSRLVDIAVGLAIGFSMDAVASQEGVGDDTTFDSSVAAEMGRQLGAFIDGLPERERRIIRYHYFHHRDFDTIGEMLEISKGRVSQLHRRAIELLRARLSAGELDRVY